MTARDKYYRARPHRLRDSDARRPCAGPCARRRVGELADRSRANPYRLRHRRRRLSAHAWPIPPVSGRISVDLDHPDRSSVTFHVQSQSVDVGSPSFDDYLRSAAFLDAAHFPSIDFVSKSVEKVDDHTVRVTGDLTLLGVTRPLSVDVAVQRETGGGGDAARLRGEDQHRQARFRHEFGLSAGLAGGRAGDLERGRRALTAEARPARWSGLIISLHWAGAAIILALIALGWAMVYGGLDAASTFDLYQWHKSFGFVALALTAARLAARFAGSSPPASRFPAAGSDGLPHSPKARSTS